VKQTGCLSYMTHVDDTGTLRAVESIGSESEIMVSTKFIDEQSTCKKNLFSKNIRGFSGTVHVLYQLLRSILRNLHIPSFCISQAYTPIGIANP
jgi:hypothetical protein